MESGHGILCARVNSLADELEQLRTRGTTDVFIADAPKLVAVAYPLGDPPVAESKPRSRSTPPHKSALAWASRTIGNAVERPVSADARSMARKEVVHLSGLTEPRTHAEFKQWVEVHLP
eukprot:4013303-Amphidinium_carterae.1